MATTQGIITMMVNQPNNALFRKYTRLGVSLVNLRHAEIGETEDSYQKAVEELIDFRRNESALRAEGIVSDPEHEKKLQQRVTELETKLTHYYLLVTLFGHVQGLQRPGKVELASFKESLWYQQSFDTKGTPWENEHDLFHAFSKKSDQLDRLRSFLIRKIHNWRESPRSGAFIDWLPKRISRRLTTLPEPELGNTTEKATPVVINPEALRRFIFWLVIFLAPCITVLPMFVLYAISSIWVRIVAVWAFSQVFVCILSNESGTSFILSANAAFCAVLAVFVGNAPS